ncbi:MAG TPA: CdaR family protein [Pyrinomonadaceae bacterium]|nr:CdaR family protein [Pyrinomonadaceae bacterium]
MPFTEPEDVSRRPRPQRGLIQRWLREIFVEDLGLKLLALAITLVLWYAVTGQRTPTTIHLRGVHLNFHLPSDMEISNDPRTEVEVTLTGNKSVLERIDARDLVAYVDISGFKPGERTVQLTPERVTLGGLPDGVRIEGIEPNAMPLRIEQRIEREIEVEARREGSVPEGYELREVKITPAKVRVRGPAGRVGALQKLSTETISLAEHRESFTVQQAGINIDALDKKIDLIDTVVQVTFEIGERRVEKSFEGVAVREGTGAQARPETATVTLYGARSALEQLRAADIQIILDVGQDGAITPRVVFPPGMENQFELRSINPSGFTIIR